MSVQVTTDFRRLNELIRRTGKEVVRIVHDGVEYGIHQHFGTVRGVTPRPFISFALERVRKSFLVGIRELRNIEDMDRFVDKIAEDAAEHARQHILLPPPRVDTSAMLNSVKASKSGEVML